MKVTVITPSEKLLEKNDYQNSLDIRIDNKRVLCLHDGEPEDNNLSRNFNDAWSIPHLLKMAYEAGIKNEGFELEEIEENE